MLSYHQGGCSYAYQCIYVELVPTYIPVVFYSLFINIILSVTTKWFLLTHKLHFFKTHKQFAASTFTDMDFENG